MEVRRETICFRFVPDAIVQWIVMIGKSIARCLVRIGAMPLYLTAAGVVFNILAAILVYDREYIPAGVTLGLGGLCDLLDGEVARLSRTCSIKTAVLDATADRFSEMVFYVALMCNLFE